MDVQNEYSDSLLAKKATGGDLQAFETLFRNHYTMIFNLSYRLCGNAHDAEDLAQDAFVKAACAIRNFRGEASFKSWIYRITLNTAWDFKRKRERKDDLHRRYAEESEIQKDGTGRSGHSEVVLAALDQLSTRQRQAIVLTFFEGLSHAEAADVLDCAETTVSWHIFAAKKKLKPYLTENGLSH